MAFNNFSCLFYLSFLFRFLLFVIVVFFLVNVVFFLALYLFGFVFIFSCLMYKDNQANMYKI